jgi:5'-nucleotidase
MAGRKRATILLTNDDGIDAPGIAALRRALEGSHELLTVAPKFEKSGAGCSLSLSNEMEVTARHDDHGKVWGYAVDGTPADCVKFAVTAIEGFRPDLVLSGVNRGQNVGNSVFYSGTVAAALEASLFGFRSMACSLACHGAQVFHYDDAARVVAGLVPWLLAHRHQQRTLWNINIPNLPEAKLGRVRLASHGTSFYVDHFKFSRQEGESRFFRNVGASLEACALREDADDRVVSRGDIALTLLGTDLALPFPAAAAESLEKEWNAPVAVAPKARAKKKA